MSVTDLSAPDFTTLTDVWPEMEEFFFETAIIVTTEECSSELGLSLHLRYCCNFCLVKHGYGCPMLPNHLFGSIPLAPLPHHVYQTLPVGHRAKTFLCSTFALPFSSFGFTSKTGMPGLS